jgi:hypothetical protein
MNEYRATVQLSVTCRDPFQRQFVYHKTHMSEAEIEHCPPQLRTGVFPPEPHLGCTRVLALAAIHRLTTKSDDMHVT